MPHAFVLNDSDLVPFLSDSIRGKKKKEKKKEKKVKYTLLNASSTGMFVPLLAVQYLQYTKVVELGRTARLSH